MKDFAQLFPYLNKSHDIYFDNAATNLKLKTVVEGEVNYLASINANPHTRDFDHAFTATEEMQKVRGMVAEFINAADSNEIIFTSGTTHSLNQIAFGWRQQFKPNANVVINSLEHASNVLPWLVLEKEGLIEVRYAALTPEGTLDLTKISEVVDENTQFFSFASVSNTIGAINDVAKVATTVRERNKNTLIIVDAAQSVAHMATDIVAWDVDFLVFSAHKIFGPFGLGVIWGRKLLLEAMAPLIYGGGNNHTITNHDFVLSTVPAKFEAGTPNIGAIYTFQYVFDFLKTEISLQEIAEIESDLKKYAVTKANSLKNKNVKFYNLENESPILLFNVEGIPSQDLGTFLSSSYNISVRTGSHCAKLLCEFNGCKTTVRASFSFLNTKAEIDTLMEALEQSSEKWLDAML